MVGGHSFIASDGSQLSDSNLRVYAVFVLAGLFLICLPPSLIHLSETVRFLLREQNADDSKTFLSQMVQVVKQPPDC